MAPGLVEGQVVVGRQTRELKAGDVVIVSHDGIEKIKRIALLEKELTLEGGELTPTLKVKRRVIDEKYRDVIDRIYE